MPQSIEKLRKKGMGNPPPPPPQPGPIRGLKVRGPAIYFKSQGFLRRLKQIMKVRESSEVVLEKKYLCELIDVKCIVDGKLVKEVERYLLERGIIVLYEGKFVKFRTDLGRIPEKF